MTLMEKNIRRFHSLTLRQREEICHSQCRNEQCAKCLNMGWSSTEKGKVWCYEPKLCEWAVGDRGKDMFKLGNDIKKIWSV